MATAAGESGGSIGGGGVGSGGASPGDCASVSVPPGGKVCGDLLIATGTGRANSVAADAAGHVFTTDADSVLRYDIATGQTLRVVGVPASAGVVPGALPASLNHPQGLAVTAGGDLLIGNVAEYVVLRARFQ